LKLRPDLPGAGGKPAEHLAVAVLHQQHTGAPVGDAATELREAVPVELGREEQAPTALLLPAQVGVDVDDRQDVQDALEHPLLVNVTLGDQGGQVEGGAQEEEASVDDHAQKRGHVGGPEHPVLDGGSVTLTVQLLRPRKLLTTSKVHLGEELGGQHLHPGGGPRAALLGPASQLLSVVEHVNHRANQILCKLLHFSRFHRTFCGRNHFQDHKTLLLGVSLQQVGHGHGELFLGDAVAGPRGLPRQVNPPHAVIESGDHLWGKSFPNVAL